MAVVTIQVLEGLERGRIFRDLPTPVTIGREDDNSIQLNDERVSRFHTKIQDDGDRIILTDLDSTNGTRVNGHPVQMRVLQTGDQMSIGRCLLVFGSPEEIAARVERLAGRKTLPSDANATVQVSGGSSGLNLANPDAPADDELGELFPDGPPEPPTALRPVQAAQLSDMIAYVHDRIRAILDAAREEQQTASDDPPGMHVDWADWQHLTNLEMDLAVYLRRIVDPDA